MSSFLGDGRGLLLAGAAAFGASILAIAEHAEQVELGYRLAAARREGQVLGREASRAERAVAALCEPAEAVRRGAALKLGLDLPKDRRILSREEVALLLAPPSAPGDPGLATALPALPRGPAAPAGEVRAR